MYIIQIRFFQTRQSSSEDHLSSPPLPPSFETPSRSIPSRSTPRLISLPSPPPNPPPKEIPSRNCENCFPGNNTRDELGCPPSAFNPDHSLRAILLPRFSLFCVQRIRAFEKELGNMISVRNHKFHSRSDDDRWLCVCSTR